MKAFSLLLILLISSSLLKAQEFLITGSNQQKSLKEFISEVEGKYPVKFFFEEKAIENISVTEDFKDIPLKQCLEKILKNTSLLFQIADNQVILYRGFELTELFPGGIQKEIQIAPSEKKLSKEQLQKLQYRILNIGTPGKNNAGTATVSGFLRNSETGESINDGAITISGTQKGTSTDKNGFYKITLPVGIHELNFSLIGMEPVKRNIKLYSDGKLDVAMEVKINLLEGATITENRNTKGEMNSREKIDIQMMKTLPSLLGEADIIKSLLLVTGVQTVGEGTSGFNVRGGNTDQNLILLDQAIIYNPTHFFGNFSAINSDVIDNATLYKGNIPIKYGGRIASVFEINTIEGNHEKVTGSTSISPLSTGINVNGPLFSDKSTFMTSFRTTYSDWVLDQIKISQLQNSKAGFFDAQLKFNLYLNKNNNLVVNFYNSQDKFQLHSDTTYQYRNMIGSIALKHRFNSNLKSNTSLVYSSYNYEVADRNSTNDSFVLTHRLSNITLNHDYEYSSDFGIKYLWGGNVQLYSVNPGERQKLSDSNILPISFSDERALEYGLYGGTEYKVSDKLKIEGGLRISGLASFDKSKEYLYRANAPLTVENITDSLTTNRSGLSKFYLTPEWRLSLSYSLGKTGSLTFSYSKTVQYIHMLSNTTAISPTDTWKLSDKYLTPAIGNQFSLGYFKSSSDNKINFSVEAFYKLVDGVKQYKAGADLVLNDHIETEIVNGHAKSYGLEMSLEKTKGRLYGRLDYTYSRTQIKSVSGFKEDQINGGEYFNANYDQPNNLNLLLNLKASRRIILSSGVFYSTGRPITLPVSKYQLGDQWFVQYSKYNEYRIPDYFRTDLSLTVNGNLKLDQLVHSSITFSLYNVTGRRNPYSIYFKSEEGRLDAYQLSIFGAVIPSVTYKLKF